MAIPDEMAASSNHQLDPSPGKDPILDDDEHDPLDDIPDSAFPGTLRLTAIMTALMLSIFLASLDVTIISTAIPSITTQFHSLDDVGWYGSAMFFPIAATQSMWGRAYKYFPMKWVFMLSIFVFELGSLICAVAPNSNAFIAGRAITGAGAAGTFAGCYVVIAFSSRPKTRPAFTSLLSATFALASVVGPLIGGGLTGKVSWRWCFYINLPCGGVAALAFFLAFHPPKAADPVPATSREKFLQMDLLGVAFICASVVCFTLAMRWGGAEKSWKSSDVVGTLIGTGLFAIAFVIDQWYQGDRALVKTSFLKKRTLLIGAIFSFFIAGAFYIELFYLPIYFQSVKGASPVASGVHLIPLIGGMTVVQIFVGVAITVNGIFNPYLYLGSAVTAVGAGLCMLLNVDTTTSKWVGYQIVAGAGIGFCFSVPIIVSQRVVKAVEMSSATAIILFFQSLGAAYAIAAAQGIFQNELLKVLPINVPNVSPAVILGAGATNIGKTLQLSPAAVEGIRKSYVHAVRLTFALGIPLAGIAFVAAPFMPWFKYIQPGQEKKASDEEKESSEPRDSGP